MKLIGDLASANSAVIGLLPYKTFDTLKGDTAITLANAAWVKLRSSSISRKKSPGCTGGKLIFHIFASLAEFERGLIRDWVLAGLEAAKKRGKKFGRPGDLLSFVG